MISLQVNGIGQFCGVAEMIGPVDFDMSVDYWQNDRWSGQFPVKWHIVKDVPNNLVRHIILGNNEDKRVTNSRDTQEVQRMTLSLILVLILVLMGSLAGKTRARCPNVGHLQEP